MVGKEGRNKRTSYRIDTHMEAQYSLDNAHGAWSRCTVVNFSRGGTGLMFHTDKKIDVGSVVHIKVLAPEEPKPIYVRLDFGFFSATLF